MAQRDEGLDKLESFIAAAAEARAALRRDAEKVADVSEEIEDAGGRLDDHMRNLGATAREIDAVIGPIYQLQMELVWTGAMPMAPGAGWALGHVTAVEQRRSIIAAADALEYAYEHFGEGRQQAADALEQADAAAGEACERFQAAAHATQEEVQPLADSVSASIDGLAQVLAENLAED